VCLCSTPVLRAQPRAAGLVMFAAKIWTSLATTLFAAILERLVCLGTTTCGHAATGAGLSAVVIEKKHQLAEAKKKPGDITVQQYHHGFWSSAFDVTVAHPLQKKH